VGVIVGVGCAGGIDVVEGMIGVFVSDGGVSVGNGWGIVQAERITKNIIKKDVCLIKITPIT